MNFQVPTDRDVYADTPVECDDIDGVPVTRAEAIALACSNRARIDALMRAEVERDAANSNENR
ncbi:MAG: hypothetical protein PHX83_07005 [Acidobacteriia bacterium]|nr:hypothetical protein [Terriglobia bacterium]